MPERFSGRWNADWSHYQVQLGKELGRNLKLIWTLAAKDLRVEYRSRQAFLTILFFALLILVIFNFAFDPGNPAMKEAAPGILWVSLLFPGVIQLNRVFQAEREEGTLSALILSPVDRSVLFTGKLLSTWVFMTLVDLLILGAFVVFYNLSFSFRLLWLLVLIALVGFVFSSVGTLFAAMVSSIRTRDVLLPILIFPIMVPVIVAGVNATREVLGSAEVQYLYQWLKLLAGCCIVFSAGSLMVFDYVIEE